jgi:hypothetical protein
MGYKLTSAYDCRRRACEKVVFTNTGSQVPWYSGSLSHQLESLSTFTTDAACKLHILGHDGDTLGVNSAQVGVLEQAHEVSFSCLLQSQNSGALESQIGLVILSNLTNKTLERQLSDQQPA